MEHLGDSDFKGQLCDLFIGLQRLSTDDLDLPSSVGLVRANVLASRLTPSLVESSTFRFNFEDFTVSQADGYDQDSY